MSTIKITLCLLALCTVAGTRQHSAQKFVTRAEAALRIERQESAARLLRQARLAVGRSQKSAGADEVVKRINELLPKVDPVYAERSKAETKIATKFSKLADEYGEKGWTDSARAMLERGEVFEPLIVADRLRKFHEQKKQSFAIFDYFEDGRQLYVNKAKWKFENGVVTSPTARTSAMMLLSSKSVDSGTRIRVEVKAGSRGRAALVFAYRNSNNYHLIEFIHQPNRSEIRLHRWYDGEWDKIHSRFYHFPRAARTDWLPIVVETRESEITWQIGPTPMFVDTTKAKHLSGGIGLFVGPSRGSRNSVEFRNLVIEEL